MPLELVLFGPPTLLRDGRSVSFETRKGLALLAYLALEGPQTRDALAMLLWPELDQERARATLRRTLSAIRTTTCDKEILEAERERVALRMDRVSVDAIEFRARLEKAAEQEQPIESLEAAAALAGNAPLAGLTIKGAPEFEHWQYRLKESLRRELGSVLARLVDLHRGRHDLDRALKHARRSIEIDPLNEAVHRTLMRLYTEKGDRAAAIAQYRECTRVLAEELAVVPVDETTRLYEELMSQKSSVEVGPTPPARGAPQGEMPFVGRHREMAVEGSLRSPGGRLVAIEGEPGIGKTRLAHELTVDGTEDRPTVRVRCHEEEVSHAFGVATRLLRRALDRTSTKTVRNLAVAAATEAARLAPDLRSLHPGIGEPQPLDSPGARTAFFEGAWETMIALLGEDAIVVVDDVQWLDAATLDLLAFAIRRLDRMGMKLIVTWRRDDIAPDHLVRRLVADAIREGRADHLVLDRLTSGDVAEIVERLGDRSAGFAERLFEETEGVPFFISEYLKAAGEEGSEWPLAAGIKELVRAQTGRLSDIGRQILAAAAVSGRELTADQVQSISGRSENETADGLEELERRGMIAAIAGRAAFDLSHDKVRRVVLEDTSHARRRLLHGRAADYLERMDDVATAAFHAREAGREVDAARLHAVAGRRAQALFAHEEALSHLQSALALGHSEKSQLHASVGDIETLLARYGDAQQSYEAALAYSKESPEVAGIEARIGALFLRRGESARAETHLRRAIEGAIEEGSRSWALVQLGLALRDLGSDEVAGVAGEALNAAETARDEEAIAQAHNLLGLVAADEGDLESARSHLRSAIGRSGFRYPAAHVAALNNLALVERSADRAEEAIELLADALELCRKQGDLHRSAALHNNLADVFHQIGREEDSRTHSVKAAEMFAQVGEDPAASPGIWRLVSW